MLDLKKYIADVVDYPKKGVVFKDVTPLLQDADAFEDSLDLMKETISTYEKDHNIRFNKIIAPEARGFLFGAPLAVITSKGLVVARKPNKLPRPGLSITFDIEYGQDTLIIPKDSIEVGDKVLIVDDLIATGGSAVALKQLVEQSGGTCQAAVFLIDLTFLHKKLPLDVLSIIQYDSEN